MRCAYQRPASVGLAELAQPLTGQWTFNGFPQEVQLLGRTFDVATWAAPYPNVVKQYREAVDFDAMHLEVLNDGTWRIDHTDNANPDRGHVLEHTLHDVIETPVGAVLLTLAAAGASALLVVGIVKAFRLRR